MQPRVTSIAASPFAMERVQEARVRAKNTHGRISEAQMRLTLYLGQVR